MEKNSQVFRIFMHWRDKIFIRSSCIKIIFFLQNSIIMSY